MQTNKGLTPIASAQQGAMDRALLHAARQGQTQACLDLVAQGAQLDGPIDSRRHTALHAAATAGNLGTCRALLDAGANGTAEDEHGRTVGDCAAGSWADGAVATVLGLCADPRIAPCNASGRTALHEAVSTRNVATLTALLASGADVNAVTHQGWSALHEAVQKNHHQLIPMLMRQGADSQAVSAAGLLPIHFFTQVDTLAELAKCGIGLDSPGPRGLRLVHLACGSGHEALVEALLALGVSTEHCISSQTRSNEALKKSPFLNAAQCASVEIMALHLVRFGPPKDDELKKAKRSLNKNQQVKAALASFMAMEAINSVMQRPVCAP